jgi:soluble lytic murein transglycosylase-like protein
MNSDDRYDSLFTYYNGLHNVLDWRMAKAQVKKESRFDPNAKNKISGASGLAQFMPATFAEWAKKAPDNFALYVGEDQLIDPRDPEDAIRLQAAYMAILFKVFGDIRYALAAYNWGWGHVDKLFDVTGDWGTNFPQLPAETQDYVTKILEFYNEYLVGKADPGAMPLSVS